MAIPPPSLDTLREQCFERLRLNHPAVQFFSKSQISTGWISSVTFEVQTGSHISPSTFDSLKQILSPHCQFSTRPKPLQVTLLQLKGRAFEILKIWKKVLEREVPSFSPMTPFVIPAAQNGFTLRLHNTFEFFDWSRVTQPLSEVVISHAPNYWNSTLIIKGVTATYHVDLNLQVEPCHGPSSFQTTILAQYTSPPWMLVSLIAFDDYLLKEIDPFQLKEIESHSNQWMEYRKFETISPVDLSNLPPLSSDFPRCFYAIEDTSIVTVLVSERTQTVLSVLKDQLPKNRFKVVTQPDPKRLKIETNKDFTLTPSVLLRNLNTQLPGHLKYGLRLIGRKLYFSIDRRGRSKSDDMKATLSSKVPIQRRLSLGDQAREGTYASQRLSLGDQVDESLSSFTSKDVFS